MYFQDQSKLVNLDVCYEVSGGDGEGKKGGDGAKQSNGGDGGAAEGGGGDASGSAGGKKKKKGGKGKGGGGGGDGTTDESTSYEETESAAATAVAGAGFDPMMGGLGYWEYSLQRPGVVHNRQMLQYRPPVAYTHQYPPTVYANPANHAEYTTMFSDENAGGCSIM